ncbi:MAG TPA: DUF4115 domain-containing protein [Spirochaetota bacterium]|nr:DUF4115 domain-containing protein [Spirochaetota bacterium]HPR48276.1 DUF4115 domain-containing protein [Spirochaetota bacterium]
MDSIGEKLRTTREAKKLSIKDVVKETNISPTYIEALEEEEFDKFPSETYLIGFLRGYSDFLKLDTEEIVQAYKGYKIGESATPLEELTKPTRPSFSMLASSYFNKYKNSFYIGGVVLAALLIFWGFRAVFISDVDISGTDSLKNIKEEYNAREKSSKIENIRSLQLSNDRGFVLVYKNEAVQFLVENKEVVFLLKDITDNSVVVEMLPDREVQILELEKPREVAVEKSPRPVILTLKGLTENRAKILVMLGAETGESVAQKVEEKVEPVKAESTSVIAQNKNNLQIVFEAEFTQKSFIELYLDGVRKMKGFVDAGSKERWEAVEYIQIKIGNAGGMNARINGKSYTFGAPGQVANKVISWKRDTANPNLYHINVKDW